MKLKLCTNGHQLGLIFTLLSQGLLGIHLGGGNLEILLRVLPGCIRRSKLCIDHGQTFTDELIRLTGLLVLLIVGALVVSLYQVIDKVETTQQVRILQRKSQNIHNLL